MIKYFAVHIKKILLITGLCLTLRLNADETNYCLHLNNKEQTEERNKEIDLELSNFSNIPAIAKKADEILSKLSAAKSPFILSWIKTRSLDPEKDTDQIVKLWRSYFSLNFLINKYPSKEESTDLEIEKLFDRFTSKYFTSTLKKELEKHFEIAKKLSLQQIESYSMNQEAKKEIVQTLASVKLYFPTKLKDSKFANNPLEFFDWGIAYDPTTKEINVGLNALGYSHDQTLEAVFAHELAHSFDSCRWGAYYKGEWPFQKVGTCLRQWAKPRDDSQLEELVKNKKISADLAQSLKANPTCNKSNYPPIGVQSDQLPETFADWFSAEATASIAKTGYRKDLCEERNLNSGSSYLTNHDRLFKIYFSQPIIKNKLHAKTEVTYCQFQQ